MGGVFVGNVLRDDRSPAERLKEQGLVYAGAREVAEFQRQQLHHFIREAVAAGVSESEAARLAGVTRMTVRAALGKR